MNKAAQIIEFASKNSISIALAESCTGGMVAAALTDIAGASAVIDRGFVTYSNDAKIDMLGVSATTLKGVGAVSEQVAREMVQGAQQRSLASIAVSITGIAGPGGSDHKPEGRVCFGLAQGDKISTETVEYGALGRAQVRQAACNHALDLLLKAVSECHP